MNKQISAQLCLYLSMLLPAIMLTGCGAIDAVNAVKGLQAQSDYAMIFDGNQGIYNARDGKQYKVPPAHREGHPNIMVCYQQSGIFGASAEAPLRVVADEVLSQRQPGNQAGKGSRVGGYGDGTVCYDFVIEKVVADNAEQQDSAQLAPIGAYLDEASGEVVIVGEHEHN